MKKLITFMILLFMSVVLVYGASHHIYKPLIVDGWVRTRGNVYPVWTEMYDLGKRAHWWDSLFVADAEMRSILLWSADSTDSASMSPTKLVIDSVISLYWQSSYGIFDSVFVDSGGKITSVDPSRADSGKIYVDAEAFRLESDNPTICGGYQDSVFAIWQFIGGGYQNRCGANGQYAAIVGGREGICDGYYSAILGGCDNTIASGTFSSHNAICGGYTCSIDTGNYNFIGGGHTVKIRGESTDGACAAFGVGSIVDSCLGSFAMNCHIKKADSTFGFSKQIWVIGGADSSKLTPTKLTIDSVISLYWSTPVAVADTTYTNWIAVKDSSKITVTSPVEFDSTITFNDIFVSEYIYHVGDSNTFIRFQDDNILFNAGGMNFCYFQEGGASAVKFNGDLQDIDFVVYSAGPGAVELICCDAELKRVGIGTATPSCELDINGSFHVSDTTFHSDVVIDSSNHIILGNLYVKDTTFHGGAVVDSGNHLILGRLTAGDASTDTNTVAGWTSFTAGITGDLVVVGDIKPAVVTFAGIGEASTVCGLLKNSTGSTYFSFNGATADTFILDSMRVVGEFDADTNYVTTMVIQLNVDRDTVKNTTLLTEATDWSLGAAGYSGHTYAPDIKMSRNDKFKFTFYGLMMAANNDIYIRNYILYGHYQ